ncbi:hypothetical protein SDC9_169205 [bioreactor metagenome]|uniref:Uncharacterized protein n=1 Tax=bioreactor metagenome TaxID=1076179 RepID=A0A645GDB5_9ZZZZ
MLKLLKHNCAVKRFAIAAFMLSAAVKDRHYDIHSVRLSACGLNDSFQILKMVVGTHCVFAVEKLVCAVIVPYIHI